MKKGFTLIELIAVIIILPAIALIVIPVVLNIVENGKIRIIKSSAKMYLKATKLYLSNAELNKTDVEPGTYSVMQNGNICAGIIKENKCEGNILKIEVKGRKPTKGKIIIDKKGNIKIEYLEINGYIYYKENDNYVVEKVIKTLINSNNGLITLNSSKVPYLTNYRIYGNESGVGNYNPTTNKYEIPIKVTGENLFNDGEYETYKENNYIIALSEPLRCAGEVCDYIDYESGKAIKYIYSEDNNENYIILSKPIIENIELPKIEINNEISNIFIETNIKPSNFILENYK